MTLVAGTPGPSVIGVFIDEIIISINISRSRIGATAFLVNDPPVSHSLALFSVGELPWEKSMEADGKVDGEAQASLHSKGVRPHPPPQKWEQLVR